MAHLTYPITHIEESKAMVSLSKSLYSKEALQATAYKYSGDYYIHLSDNGEAFDVLFENKKEIAVDDTTIKEICNDFIDQQIRIDTEKQFGHIRDLIVEEAFKPVNK